LILDDTNQKNLIQEDIITEVTHQVMRGETIKSIAEKYKVSEEDIILWNELSNTANLSPNSRLKIRKTGSDF
jgi:LysM repeat protein